MSGCPSIVNVNVLALDIIPFRMFIYPSVELELAAEKTPAELLAMV